jgi:hypothetical protein
MLPDMRRCGASTVRLPLPVEPGKVQALKRVLNEVTCRMVLPAKSLSTVHRVASDLVPPLAAILEDVEAHLVRPPPASSGSLRRAWT